VNINQEGDEIVRVYKVGDNLACILPKGMVEKLKLNAGEEVDFYEIKPGVFTLVKKDAVEGMLREQIGEVEILGGKKGLSPEEMELLRKLNSIKFSERIPYNVHKKLDSKERDVLSRLVEDGAVRIYKGGKYSKTGVYDISNDVYSILKNEKQGRTEPTPEAALDKAGYAVIDDAREVERICNNLEKEIRGGNIIGTRGFDKKFYIARRSWLVGASEKVRQVMKKGAKNVYDLSRELRMDESALRVVLEIMREKGDAIERSKGVYELV